MKKLTALQEMVEGKRLVRVEGRRRRLRIFGTVALHFEDGTVLEIPLPVYEDRRQVAGGKEGGLGT